MESAFAAVDSPSAMTARSSPKMRITATRQIQLRLIAQI
jgi:hypothetical protein